MRQARNRSIWLMAPERHAGRFGQIARLVEKARTQAAGIGFLQTDHVELGQHFGKEIEIVQLAAPGQHGVDRASEVLAVTLHAGAGEDVAAQQAQTALGGWLGRTVHSHVITYSWTMTIAIAR